MKSIRKWTLMLVAAFTFGGIAMADEVNQEKRTIDPKARAEKMTERMVKEYDLNDMQKKQLLDLNQAFAEKLGDRPARPHHGKKVKSGDMAKAGKGDKANQEGITKENKERKGKDQARADRDGRKNRPDASKLSAEEREKRQQEMKRAHEEYKAQLQKIMNADQYQAFAKKQVEREQKRQERGEKMKENRGKKAASGKSDKQVLLQPLLLLYN
ncbi:MAG: DUF4890 domain-containing protein [Tannerellaceae bacterium]|nr:DUF4890 domain-containing protein [Tannerellaceae bacterium]